MGKTTLLEKDLTTVKLPTIDPVRYKLTARGIEWEKNVRKQDFLDCLQEITLQVKGQSWLIGDIAQAAQARNMSYKDVAEELGMQEQSVKNIASVCARVPFNLRRSPDVLTYTHHAVVASLPVKEQEEWLKKTEDEGWSVAALKSHLRKAQLAGDATKTSGVDKAESRKVQSNPVTPGMSPATTAPLDTPARPVLSTDSGTHVEGVSDVQPIQTGPTSTRTEGRVLSLSVEMSKEVFDAAKLIGIDAQMLLNKMVKDSLNVFYKRRELAKDVPVDASNSEAVTDTEEIPSPPAVPKKEQTPDPLPPVPEVKKRTPQPSTRTGKGSVPVTSAEGTEGRMSMIELSDDKKGGIGSNP